MMPGMSVQGGPRSNDWSMGMQLPGQSMGGGSSIGGVQNVPNLFGMDPTAGFGGMNASMANPSQNWMQGLMGGQPDYLQNIAGGGGAGMPVNQMPAWQSMVNAQNYNIQTGADQLAEQFNGMGGLFGTAYGSAQGQYQQQARVGQNAQLTQAQMQAMQQAQQNQLTASQQLSGQQFGGAQQASQLGTQAALAQMQNQLGWGNLGLQGALGMGQLSNQNQLTGNQLANSQMLANQNQLTAAYQNWYMSQPQNNPLLSMMYAGATGYPQLQQSTYQPGALGSLLGGLGGLAGGIGGLGGAGGLGALLGLSDRRLKENLVKVNEDAGLNIYTYNFIGDPISHTGFIAQEVYEKYPECIKRGGPDPLTDPWMIDYSKLTFRLAGDRR